MKTGRPRGRPRAEWHETTERVVARMLATGLSQTDALDAELPGLPDSERAVWVRRVAHEVAEMRTKGRADGIPVPLRGRVPAGSPPRLDVEAVLAVPTEPEPEPAPSPSPPRPAPGAGSAPSAEHPAVGLDRIPSLRRQLSQAERALDAVIEDRQWRHFGPLDSRRFAIASELERELERVRQVVTLDPSPAELFAWLDEHRELVERGADLERRRARLAAK